MIEDFYSVEIINGLANKMTLIGCKNGEVAGEHAPDSVFVPEYGIHSCSEQTNMFGNQIMGTLMPRYLEKSSGIIRQDLIIKRYPAIWKLSGTLLKKTLNKRKVLLF